MKFLYRRLFLGAASLVLASAARAEEPANLAAYAADPAISHVAVAPDGHAVAFIETKDGKRFLGLLPANAGGPHRVDTGSLDIRDVSWAGPSHLLILRSTFLSEPPSFPSQRVSQGIVLDERTGKYRIVLGETDGVIPLMGGGVVAIAKHDHKPMLFLTGLTTDLRFGLYAVDLDTGRGVHIGDASWGGETWVTASDGFALAEKSFSPTLHHSILTAFSVDQSHPVQLPDPDRPFELKGLGRTDDTVSLISGGDLLEVDALTGHVSAPLQPAGQSVEAVYRNGANRLVAAKLLNDTPTYAFFDEALARAWDQARAPFPGSKVELVSFSDDYSSLVVKVTGAQSAGAYYWVDLRAGKAELVGEAYPALTGERFAVSRPFSFGTVDAKTLTGFLTLPPKYEGKGHEEKNLPAVVLVHDDPLARDDGGFDATAQALAASGYAVIRVNYRGSAGSGVSGQGEWGRRMQTDLSDAVDELAKQGTIDRHRVCIAGEAYGGYAALAGVTLQSGVYRCAIAINPIADMRKAARFPSQDIRGPAWDAVAMRRPLVAGGGVDSEVLDYLSPITHADYTSAPILLVQVADTTTLPTTEAGEMQHALKQAGHPSQLVQLDPIKQDLGEEAGRKAELEAIIAFLNRQNPS